MFASHVKKFSAALDSLRDFVNVVHAHLLEEQSTFLEKEVFALAPLLVMMEKMGAFSKDAVEGVNAHRLERALKGLIDIEIMDEQGGKAARIKRLDPELEERFHPAMESLGKVTKRIGLLYNGSLMNLTSIVELLFADLFRTYLAKYPEVIGTKEKLFSLEDLAKFGTVDDARAFYVTKRIEDILYGSFREWLSFLKNNAKLSMQYMESDLDCLVETFQRRNLVVHNDGVVNALYLHNVEPSLTVDTKVGNQLRTDPDYLNQRIDLFEKNCILLTAELWKKLMPDDEERGGALNDIVYRRLKASKWQIAEGIAYFLVSDRQLSEATRCVGALNFWLCKKRQGKWGEVEKDVMTADYSARSLRFQLGLLALQGKNDDWFNIVGRALQAEEIDRDELNEFPVLEEIRADVRFDVYRTDPEDKPLDAQGVLGRLMRRERSAKEDGAQEESK